MLLNVFIPFLLGFTMIGGALYKTIAVVKGNVAQALAMSMLVGVVYFFSIQYAANHEVDSYIAYSLGTCLATGLLAYREKHRSQKEDE